MASQRASLNRIQTEQQDPYNNDQRQSQHRHNHHQHHHHLGGHSMGDLSDSLAGLSVGDYGVVRSSTSGTLTQNRNSHGSLSILNNDGIGLNWDSAGGNLS
jgi:hypothetical protein